MCRCCGFPVMDAPLLRDTKIILPIRFPIRFLSGFPFYRVSPPSSPSIGHYRSLLGERDDTFSTYD